MKEKKNHSDKSCRENEKYSSQITMSGEHEQKKNSRRKKISIVDFYQLSDSF